ncbi:MAG TPA: hypothetical protein VGI67_12415 [Thermoleophilaceae bacterium]|jgi:hypothetical protein
MAESNPLELPDGVKEEAVDELYGLPLEEFTARRDELAKELRSADEREGAAWVKALRKPSQPAWLVNQLARTQTADAKGVLDSADALRAAQERTLAGAGSPQELARASEEHAGAMRALLAKAPGMLDAEGRSPSNPTLYRAAETLRATALDEDARAAFAAGRLTREQRAAGLGFAPVSDADEDAEPPSRSRRKAAAVAARPKKEDSEQKARAQAQAALKTVKAELKERSKEVAEHERAVRAAEREAEAAQSQLKQATNALERARADEAHARARVEKAEAAAERLR